jgi:hypothetical protein
MAFTYLRAAAKSQGDLYVEPKTYTQKIRIQINIKWGVSYVSTVTRPLYNAQCKIIGVEKAYDESYRILYSSKAPETATFVINGEIKWEYSIIKGRNKSVQESTYTEANKGYMLADLKTLKGTMFTNDAYFVFGGPSSELSNRYALAEESIPSTSATEYETLLLTYNLDNINIAVTQGSWALQKKVTDITIPTFNNLRLMASYVCFRPSDEQLDIIPTQTTPGTIPTILEALVIRGYPYQIKQTVPLKDGNGCDNTQTEWVINPNIAEIENYTKATFKSKIAVSNFLKSISVDLMLEPGSLIGKADYNDKTLQSWYDLETPIPTIGKMITFIEQDITNIKAKNLSTKEITTIT